MVANNAFMIEEMKEKVEKETRKQERELRKQDKIETEKESKSELLNSFAVWKSNKGIKRINK